MGECAFRVMSAGESHVLNLDRDNNGGDKKAMQTWNPDSGDIGMGTAPVALGRLALKPSAVDANQLKLMGFNYSYGSQFQHQNQNEGGSVSNNSGTFTHDIHCLGQTRRMYTATSVAGSEYHYWSTAGSERLRIANNGDLTATDTSIASNSDERVKENISHFTYDLEKFKKLQPREFDWINPIAHNNKSDNRGFIAQEIQAVDDFWIGGVPIHPDSDDYDLIPADSAGDHTSLTSKLGQKDAMYVSVMNQLLEKIETLEANSSVLEQEAGYHLDNIILDGTNGSSANAGDNVLLG
jgi:hypothetical protein